ncbi:Glucose-6-phosphate 1-dehydrogenase [Dictyocoela roeselum]|nr:Glucose-6-phosphate 1-dehydrogenase [Dictyocoela roeselum]
MIFIFGASGDLAKRKIFPSLKNLSPRIVAFARHDYSKTFHSVLRSFASYPDAFLENIIYIQGQYGDLSELAKLAKAGDTYYLALPPSVYAQILPEIAKLPGGYIAIEKPYGDTASDIRALKRFADSNPKFEMRLVDHYLLKPMSLAMPAFFKKPAQIKSLMNNDYVEQIIISGKEKIGVEGRLYFNKYGIIKDIIQNHLAELLCLVVAGENRSEKMEILRNMEVDRDAFFGQYDMYKKEIGEASNTETYAKIKLKIDNDRWRNVPIYMIAGKGLNEKLTQIEIVFKENKRLNLLVNKEPVKASLVFNIYPDNEIFILADKEKTVLLDSNEIEKIQKEKFGELNDYSLIFHSLVNHSDFPSANLKEAEMLWDIFSKFHNSPRDLKIYPKGIGDPTALSFTSDSEIKN